MLGPALWTALLECLLHMLRSAADRRIRAPPLVVWIFSYLRDLLRNVKDPLIFFQLVGTV